jgi:hypothetical protein
VLFGLENFNGLRACINLRRSYCGACVTFVSIRVELRRAKFPPGLQHTGVFEFAVRLGVGFGVWDMIKDLAIYREGLFAVPTFSE